MIKTLGITRIHRLLCAAALGLLVASNAQAEARFDLQKTKTVLSGLIEQSLKERGIPSISIALVKDDAIVWKAAFGYANVRTRTPATPQTIYSAGSTFKAVTAAAVMQLVEQGKIKLDQPVNESLEGIVRIQDRLQSEQPVTVEHILSHWSGLTGDYQLKPIWGRTLPQTLKEAASELYSIRAPGTQWEYNNAAYALAGFLLEQVSGVEYEKYIVENVLKPLGARTPHPAYPSPEMVELMALPYKRGRDGQPPTPVEQVHFDVYPAGDVYLTAEEMAFFLGAHLNGGVFNGKRILSEASVKDMRTPRFGGTYGFGFNVKKDERGHTIIDHGGSVPGQNSYLLGDVDARVGVYFMSNSGASAEIAQAALQLLRGEDYTPSPKQKS